MANVYGEIEIDTMEMFWDIFFINNDMLKGYLYRGHADCDWLLQPTLQRQHSSLNRNDFLLKEVEYLVRFYINSNDNGLYVPEIRKFSNGYVSNMYDLSYMLEEGEYYWMADEIVELAALAQHHGIPTRLLDWTQDVMTAFYFAFMGNLEKEMDKDCAIWCINAHVLQRLKIKEKAYNENIVRTAFINSDKNISEGNIYEIFDNSIPLIFVVPQYSNNANLSAQKGVLTLWRENIIEDLSVKHGDEVYKDIKAFNSAVYEEQNNFFNNDNKKISLEEQLKDYFEKRKTTLSRLLLVNGAPILLKVTVKNKLIRSLMQHIAQHGYTAAKLFPGYNGVVRSISERQYYI